MTEGWGLTAIEHATIRAIIEHGSNKAAARALNRSVKTVDYHMQVVIQKAGLGVGMIGRTRTLVAYSQAMWMEEVERARRDERIAMSWLSEVREALGPELAFDQLVDQVKYLQGELDGSHQSIIKMGGMLTDIVNAIRGEPAPGTEHSTHDAVELVRGVVARLPTRTWVTS